MNTSKHKLTCECPLLMLWVECFLCDVIFILCSALLSCQNALSLNINASNICESANTLAGGLESIQLVSYMKQLKRCGYTSYCPGSYYRVISHPGVFGVAVWAGELQLLASKRNLMLSFRSENRSVIGGIDHRKKEFIGKRRWTLGRWLTASSSSCLRKATTGELRKQIIKLILHIYCAALKIRTVNYCMSESTDEAISSS